jgi:Resolvase, N terminal domain
MCIAPLRLARNYAHQVLLLEEFLRAGVEVVFLNREVGQTAEDQLLLQVQGMKALVRTGENSGTESARETAPSPGRQRERPFLRSLRVPLCQQMGGWRRGSFRDRAGGSTGGPSNL